MTTNSTSSIFKDGKLKPGVYKIQNLRHQNYLDIQEDTRKLWGYPAKDLKEGRGFWEIKSLGAGYTVKRVEPGKPDQFCNPMEGLDNGTPLYVAPFPIPWRIEVVDDDKHRGFEYTRFYWGTTKRAWDTYSDGKVQFWEANATSTNLMLKLIPVKVEGTLAPSQLLYETLGSGSLPSYDEDATGQPPTHAQRVESERDDFGTVVTEITTITTRKRYRVQDA